MRSCSRDLHLEEDYCYDLCTRTSITLHDVSVFVPLLLVVCFISFLLHNQLILLLLVVCVIESDCSKKNLNETSTAPRLTNNLGEFVSTDENLFPSRMVLMLNSGHLLLRRH
jgi:hypothetical protein